MCAADVDAEGPRGPYEARLQVDAQGKKLATKKDYYCTAGTHSAAELLRSVRRRAGARRCRYQLGTGWDRIPDRKLSGGEWEAGGGNRSPI